MTRKNLWEAIGGGPANFPNYDARTGLGYGTQSGFHAHRQYQGTFPYVTPPSDDELEVDEEERDDEFDSKVSKKLSVYIPTDDLATKKNDPFYFFGAATRFESIGRNPTHTSMVPIPDLYKGRESGMVGSNNWQVTKPILRTKATPHGTAKSPILSEPSEDQMADPELSKLRELIKVIFNSNVRER